jgi:hypothetical protein
VYLLAVVSAIVVGGPDVTSQGRGLSGSEQSVEGVGSGVDLVVIDAKRESLQLIGEALIPVPFTIFTFLASHCAAKAAARVSFGPVGRTALTM